MCPRRTFAEWLGEEGCENSLQLYREIRTQGYDGCRSVITNYIGQLRQQYGKMAATGRQPTTQPKPLKDGLPLPVDLRFLPLAYHGWQASHIVRTTDVFFCVVW